MMSNLDRTIAIHLPLAQCGDRQAFTILVAATQNMVTSIALAVVRDIGHSEDIAQETYLAVWRRLKSLRNPESFLPWLRQITRNLARDHLRRSQVRPGDHPISQDANTLAKLAAEADAESHVLADEQDKLIAQALESVPDESREVLTLFYREGRSSRQVATLLGLSDAAVRKRLSRARSNLRHELESILGETLVRTVPGIAFTTLIGSLLVTASPPAAAAMALSAGAKGATKLAAGAGLGMFIALIGGIAGVILGLRKWIVSSTDPAERAALERLRTTGIVTVVLAVAAFGISAWLPGWLPATVVFVLFIGAIGWQHLIALPRILDPRLAEQRRLNSTAARSQRRHRILAWTGMIIGTLAGGAGLLTGLLAAGRIAF